MKHAAQTTDQSILFFRHLVNYTGGHQKVYDYFSHVDAHPNFRACINFSNATVWNQANPWHSVRNLCRVDYEPERHTHIFLAGTDWLMYERAGIVREKPVLNLIQHVRHASPGENVYPFLRHKAIRICVSHEVADSISSTGLTQGPIITIPNGHNIEIEPTDRIRDVFVLGLKQPQLARDVTEHLSEKGLSVSLSTGIIPRSKVLKLMATSRITVALPKETEGFYLPAIEAMALSDVTIVPDCIGNRTFCRHTENCLMPSFNLEEIVHAVSKGIDITNNRDRLEKLRIKADTTVAEHSLDNERRLFHDLLDNINNIW